MKFKVKDDYGQVFESQEYVWNKDDGIPNEEQILEDMEECTCMLHEDNPYCDGSCQHFENGEVIGIIQ